MWPVATMAGGVNNHALRVLILCVLWYIVSSSNNVIGKTLLMRFSYPMTVTMVQLVSITVYSGPLFKLWGVRTRMEYGSKYWWRVIIPLAFGKFVASVSAHVSLWKVSVSYSHTVKASMPLFTVILTRVLFGEIQPRSVYLSLAPIIFGVVIATVTEISFDTVGLISAIIATIGFSLQNIFSKKVLLDTGIHHLRLLQLLGQLALLMFLPLWLLSDCRTILSDSSIFEGNFQETILLLFMDGFLNWLQNIIAFSVLSLVTPLSYAVANASKRICIISISLLTLRNPVTPLNIFGMMLAIIGVFLYNKAKYDAHRQAKAKPILPVIKGPSEASKSLLFSDVADTLPRNSYHLSLPPEGNVSPPMSNGMTRNPYSSVSLNSEWL